MGYHIDTGLIKDKLKENSECPLCAIKSVVEEQLLFEFLNDAVMQDDTRKEVNKLGFCSTHYDMLFARENKLSLALQIYTRLNTLKAVVKDGNSAKKQSKEIFESEKTCIICSLTEESMVKYYKTIAQLFAKEGNFYKTLLSSKGFCMHHYAELLKYSNSAGFAKKEYVKILTGVQKMNLERLQEELKVFCDKHDYRNAHMPLGNSETALIRLREKLYGKKSV